MNPFDLDKWHFLVAAQDKTSFRPDMTTSIIRVHLIDSPMDFIRDKNDQDTCLQCNPYL